MASQTITGPDLQYTQDNKHCFAYSGPYNANDQLQTELSFLTNSGFIRATFGFCGAVDPAQINSGTNGLFRVNFNGFLVAQVKLQTGEEDMPSAYEMELIIPPHTEVTVTNLDASSTSTFKQMVYIVGRVYEHLPVRN